jgi:hypothetical protein
MTVSVHDFLLSRRMTGASSVDRVSRSEGRGKAR